LVEFQFSVAAVRRSNGDAPLAEQDRYQKVKTLEVSVIWQEKRARGIDASGKIAQRSAFSAVTITETRTYRRVTDAAECEFDRKKNSRSEKIYRRLTFVTRRSAARNCAHAIACATR
jgi:hypothetical protein